MPQPLRRENLNRAVRDYIKQYIVDNGLSGGAALPPEAQLADDMGVGRSSVREAVRALQSLGIVEARQGDGLYVREYNFDPVYETVQYGMRTDTTTQLELTQIRVLLESAAIEAAVERITPEQLDALDQLMVRWEARAAACQSENDLDEEFHDILYGAMGNTTLLKLLKAFWAAFAAYRDPTLDVPERIARSLAEHKAILEAVRERDPVEARRRLMIHFHDLHQRVKKITGDAIDSWFNWE